MRQPTGVTVYSLSELLENLLANIGLALVDNQWWRVIHHEVLQNICTKQEIKVAHLISKHMHTWELLRCSNAHMPSSAAAPLRKEHCVKKMCHMATDPPIV